jgi:GNAT superfamily N-acetyltransferase
MTITFRPDVPIEDTMIFEAEFEPELQLSLADKTDVIHRGLATWMFVDGVLAGETYGTDPLAEAEEGEDLEDVKTITEPSVYCFSTAVLPPFQGKGFGSLLKVYWLGMMRGQGHTLIIGHATTPAMVKINQRFGAEMIRKHERWYDTERTAWFYTLRLR